jgi:hypothetical protein
MLSIEVRNEMIGKTSNSVLGKEKKRSCKTVYLFRINKPPFAIMIFNKDPSRARIIARSRCNKLPISIMSAVLPKG